MDSCSALFQYFYQQAAADGVVTVIEWARLAFYHWLFSTLGC